VAERVDYLSRAFNEFIKRSTSSLYYSILRSATQRPTMSHLPSKLSEKEAIAFHKDVASDGHLLQPKEREQMLRRYLPATPRSVSPSPPRTATRKPSRRKSKKPLRAFVLNQVHILLYTLIHTVYSIYVRLRSLYHAVIDRIFAILYYHHRTPELIRKDVSKLSKVPGHLSVVLQFQEDEDRGLAGLVNDVAEIAAWCVSAGVPQVSVYERKGTCSSS